MSCGCKSCGCGRAPKQQRQVLEGAYKVQPGDDVGGICRALGASLTQWPQLVGANLHKPLGKPPYGYTQRCFESLEAGEKLNVPAAWTGAVGGPLSMSPFEPGSSSQTGQTVKPGSSGPTIDRLSLMIAALKQSGLPEAINNLLGAVGLPTGVDMEDVFAVMYSWWQYAKFPHPPNVVPPTPTPGTPPAVSIDLLVQLGKSAVEFLRTTGITNGKSPQVQDIPWDSILWSDVPWTKLGGRAISDLSRIMGSLPTPVYAMAPAAGPNQTPDFFNVDWKDQPWSDMLKDVTMSEGLVEILGDPKAVECINRDPNRLKKMLGCENCYADTDAFKKILCSSTPADPCDCQGGGGGGGGGGGSEVQPAKSDNTGLIVAASVIGVLGITATAFALSSKKG